jgi:hypothetical protein
MYKISGLDDTGDELIVPFNDCSTELQRRIMELIDRHAAIKAGFEW